MSTHGHANISCPYCGCGTTEPTVSAYLELGSYDGKNYESEGDVEGHCCASCGGIFWTNGPALPVRPECFGNAPDEELLPPESIVAECEACDCARLCGMVARGVD